MIIEEILYPNIDYDLFSSNKRENGISGFMRLRNEGEFLAHSIESWLPLLDELIIVYNNCQDNTGSISEKYATLYPNKVKVYHYLPVVYPQGSSKYKELDDNDYHSLVNYYNFALSKTTKKWAIKLDGDLILDQSKKSLLLEKYRELEINRPECFLPVSGINLVDNEGKLFVPSSSKYCGVYGDLCLFRVDKDSIFKKGENVEYLDLSKRTKLPNIFAYYHLKFIKNDFGIGNYDFRNNPYSSYYAKTVVAILMMRFISIDKVCTQIGLSKVELSDFKITHNRNYKKEARKYLSSTGGKLVLSKFIVELYYYIYISVKNFIKSKLLKI